MLTARINSTPRLFPSGCSLSFVVIVLCAALCQATHTNGFRQGDIVEGFYTPDQTWYGATVLDPVLSARPTLVRLLWDDVHGESYFMVVKVEHVRFRSMLRVEPLCASDSSEDCDNFRSALGIDDLTAIILQYAMHAREARQKLTADPTLAHLYHNHARGFQEESGVEVIGAGDTQLNGWYARKEVCEAVRRKRFSLRHCDWAQSNAGRYWYEKDDGCSIRAVDDINKMYGMLPDGGWVICGSKSGDVRYTRYVPAEQDDGLASRLIAVTGLPPAQGWRCRRFGATAPAPTLQVML